MKPAPPSPSWPELAAQFAPRTLSVRGLRHGATGWVWGSGWVVTPLHGLDHADTLEVAGDDETTYAARVKGRDRDLGLAVLEVEGLDVDAPTPWRDAATLRLAEPVLVLGRPGRTPRAALGVLGAVAGEFALPSGVKLERYVELDRRLSRHFGAGPVIDGTGHGIGLVLPGTGRGPALICTSSTLGEVVTQLTEHGDLQQGYLGVGVFPAALPEPLAGQTGYPRGIVVVAVQDGGPGQHGGLALGDLVVAVNGSPVESPLELRGALRAKPGHDVTMTVLRGGQRLQLSVQPGVRS